MPPPFFTHCKTLYPFLPNSLLSSLKSLSSSSQQQPQQTHLPLQSPIGSPARIQKLIAAQPDPLLAKEIFDLASLQPNFRHSYPSYHTLILKLARSRHFSLSDSLLRSLRSQRLPSVAPGLFSSLFQIYADAGLPSKSLQIFDSMLHDFNCKPRAKHFNRLLLVLAERPRLLPAALSLFKSAARHGIAINTRSYNILMRAFCFNGRLSVAYSLFNQMHKHDLVPDVESYRILMQGLCRKSQVNTASDLLEDMLNKGFVPDALSYTTLLNSLCRKKKLREAYKLLCRMKVKGCNPDIIHYNTVILGFCREGRPLDACKVLEEMPSNGCIPNLVSFSTLVNGLCDHGMLDEAKGYMEVMIARGLSPHFSAFHKLVKGFCNVGKIEEAFHVLSEMLRHGVAPHLDTWVVIVPRICDEDGMEVEEIVRMFGNGDWKRETKIIDAGFGLGGMIRRERAKIMKS
ncbi:pentatricopeptide repeat-containing protein At4g01400, mitochondrial-like [Magnolia sinica]|uniref:pentatricopeptide repeat-containing protein At4g01400, mitochondrial-like n=1 Tax=Magnolia sinica TaxID=86752 RepID=UPI002659F7DC|nr:pentatricopeptide repeat-containing protein At4g01400, mitochondrial-like [Magnolia sinica]XP_058105027.1 pentatricopeptide repeat-containing protein At4g01400, mitochondrial-like [Magnolia sinica]